MGFTDIFTKILAGDALQGIKELIAEFHLSPDDKIKAEQFTQQLEVQKEQIESARDIALAQIQSTNITAETKSEDPYVRRARPTFLYLIMIALGFDLIVYPILQMLGMAVSAIFGHVSFVAAMQTVRIMEVPVPLLELFGISYLGYVGARTWDKTKVMGK